MKSDLVAMGLFQFQIRSHFFFRIKSTFDGFLSALGSRELQLDSPDKSILKSCGAEQFNVKGSGHPWKRISTADLNFDAHIMFIHARKRYAKLELEGSPTPYP